MLKPYTVLAIACLFVTSINWITLRTLLSRCNTPRFVLRNANYSYRGSDHPTYLVAPDRMPRVALDVEESVHNGLGLSARDDWEDMDTAFGWYKLGPTHHRYAPTMYHERHCLRMLHRALFPELVHVRMTDPHTQHCLSYLRQMTLCYPDLTLEPPDVLSRNWEIDKLAGSTHVCRDWTLPMIRGDELEEQWLLFRATEWDTEER